MADWIRNQLYLAFYSGSSRNKRGIFFAELRGNKFPFLLGPKICCLFCEIGGLPLTAGNWILRSGGGGAARPTNVVIPTLSLIVTAVYQLYSIKYLKGKATSADICIRDRKFLKVDMLRVTKIEKQALNMHYIISGTYLQLAAGDREQQQNTLISFSTCTYRTDAEKESSQHCHEYLISSKSMTQFWKAAKLSSGDVKFRMWPARSTQRRAIPLGLRANLI